MGRKAWSRGKVEARSRTTEKGPGDMKLGITGVEAAAKAGGRGRGFTAGEPERELINPKTARERLPGRCKRCRSAKRGVERSGYCWRCEVAIEQDAEIRRAVGLPPQRRGR